MKHVVLYVGHLYKLFWTKKNWPGWQGGSKKVKIWPRMGLAFIYFWPRSLLEAPKWVKDPGNTPKMIPPTAPDWFESLGISPPRQIIRLCTKSQLGVLHLPWALVHSWWYKCSSFCELQLWKHQKRICNTLRGKRTALWNWRLWISNMI